MDVASRFAGSQPRLIQSILHLPGKEVKYLSRDVPRDILIFFKDFKALLCGLILLLVNK